MACSLARMVAVSCCVLILAQTMLVWNSTGRAGYTRFRDEARAAREAGSPGAADLFADTGLGGASGVAIAVIPNEFALGLLPSTYPWRVWDPHIVSVLTIGAPALLCGAVGLRAGRSPRGSGRVQSAS